MKKLMASLALVAAFATILGLTPGISRACSTCGSGDTTPPTPVEFSYDRMDDYELIFTWTKNTDADFGYYKLAVSETDSTPNYPDNFSGIAISDRDQISLRVYYGSIGMERGHTYYVAMSVRDSSGNVGTSNVVSVEIPADAPTKTTDTKTGTKTTTTTKTSTVVSGKSLMAYNSAFRGGVNVATGDLNGDGENEIITGAGQGGGPQVRIFDKDYNLLGQFMAFSSTSRSGVNVATGDVDGDGKDEIIVGQGQGLEGWVKTINADLDAGEFVLIGEWNAYGTAPVGAYVAAGDVNGDGRDEIITGPGSAGTPRVRVFSPVGREVKSFYAFSNQIRKGAFVASGADFDRDGKQDIVVGEGPGSTSLVRVFRTSDYKVISEFQPYATAGSHVAVGDVNNDGTADIVTGAGIGGGPHVRAFKWGGNALTVNFFPYTQSFRGGVNVSAADLNNTGRAEILTGAGVGGGPQIRTIERF